jgi:hypothetical protein
MRFHLLAAITVAAAIAPAAAFGAGYPVPGMDTTQQGATAPGDPYRYIALPSKGGMTQLIKLRRQDGRVLRHRELDGASVVAPVAIDASTTGLSADGATLVLIEPRRAPAPRVTHMVVVDTLTLRPERRLALRGDFTLDGVSPDGRRLYVVQYHGDSPLDYAVRAYDVAHRRLLPHPIVDPRNPDEKMTGFPMTRATSADGRWAYTLYSGGEESFVHALDTARGRAFCVDLDGLSPDTLSAMRLVAGPGHVNLVNEAGETIRRIDASTFKVTTPKPPAVVPVAAPKDDAAPGGGFPWGVAAAVAAVAAAALLVLRRRYATGTDAAASSSASSSTPTLP